MKKKTKSIVKKDKDETIYNSPSYWDKILTKEFSKESDRASIILTAAMFDNALENLLKNCLLPVAGNNDELFDGSNAPLSNFSSRINFAYRLGLISHNFSRDLHLIRKMRNEFAHNIHGCNFNDASIRNRVSQLCLSSKIAIKNPGIRKGAFPPGVRGDFLMVCSWMLWALNEKVEEISTVKGAKPEFGYEDYASEKKPKRKKRQK